VRWSNTESRILIYLYKWYIHSLISHKRRCLKRKGQQSLIHCAGRKKSLDLIHIWFSGWFLHVVTIITTWTLTIISSGWRQNWFQTHQSSGNQQCVWLLHAVTSDPVLCVAKQDSCLLGCNTVLLGKCFLMFLRNVRQHLVTQCHVHRETSVTSLWKPQNLDEMIDWVSMHSLYFTGKMCKSEIYFIIDANRTQFKMLKTGVLFTECGQNVGILLSRYCLITWKSVQVHKGLITKGNVMFKYDDTPG
jgi:hypothetical protein